MLSFSLCLLHPLYGVWYLVGHWSDLNSASSPPRDWYLSSGVTLEWPAVLSALPAWTLSRTPLYSFTSLLSQVLLPFWMIWGKCLFCGFVCVADWASLLLEIICLLLLMAPLLSLGTIRCSQWPSFLPLSLLMLVRFVFIRGSLVKWDRFSFVLRDRTLSCWALL